MPKSNQSNLGLILARHLDERVILRLPDGREAVITVAALGESTVRLGILAPDDVQIIREELADGWRYREPGGEGRTR